MSEPTNESHGPQEPDGKAMGSVRKSDRPDPITGRPLYDSDTADAEEPDSSHPAADTYSATSAGVTEESTQVPPGEPSSTPREEPELRDL